MSRVGLPVITLALATLSACATGHSAMSGSVIMKVSDTQAHVCLFEHDAAIGAKVQLYRHSCVGQYATPGVSHSRQPYTCQKQAVAIGTVAQKMGDHYALVTFPEGTKYEEGYTIEPMP
jgi:hypothetical protein